jgi:hypothetical protein
MAEDEKIPCAYCGQLRYPEDMLTHVDDGSKYSNKKMCVGCFDDEEDEAYEKRQERR